MKSKLHFGILIILMTFLARYLESSVVPNQQIVIQFSDKKATFEDTRSAIEVIQKKLQTIGIEDIQIGQHHNGQLRITYYSEANIISIQNILSKENGFKLAYDTDEENPNKFPEDRDIKSYELNISEIQNGNDANWDFEGTEVAQLNQKSDRFNYSKDNTSGEKININGIDNSTNVALKVKKISAVATNNNSYKIPEVRAGPIT